MDRMKGRLLVATPVLGDGNFDRTVVLLLEHGDDGALGLVLNRPSGLAVGEPLPEWRAYAPEPEVVFIGGPVSRSSVIALARLDGDPPAGTWEQVLGEVGVLDLTADPEDLAAGLGAVRVYAGYAGWAPGQLEEEIGTGAWYVVTAETDDVFTGAPERLWRTVLARQPGDMARAALVPEDPRVN
jgi:putative transcriptional regulator